MAYGKRKSPVSYARRTKLRRAFVAKARTVRRTKAPSRVFKKRVLKVLNTTNETKVRTTVITSWTEGTVSPIDYDSVNIYGGGLATGYVGTSGHGFFMPNVLEHIPIIQGTTQQQRIGNAINVKSLNLKGFIACNPYDLKSNPQVLPYEVHLIIYKKKNDKGGNPETILEYPGNSNGDLDGSAKTSMYPWNKSQFVIKKHRVFRMKPPGAIVDASAADPDIDTPVVAQTMGSSTLPYFQRFSVNVPIAKKLMYNDPNTTNQSKYPVNDHFSLGMYIINGDGVPLSSSRAPAYTFITATLKYTDP